MKLRFPSLAPLMVAAAASCVVVPAAGQSAFEDADKDFDRTFQELEDEFARARDAIDEEWEAWARADSLAFARFRAEVVGRWGDYRGTTRKDWVEYGEGLDSRTVVDFAAGEATVEVLVPAGASEDERRDQLRAATARLAGDRGRTMDYPVLDQAPHPLLERPVLADQLAGPDGEPVTAATAPAFAEQVVEAMPVTATPVVSDDGVQRVKLAVTVPLVPNHLRVRAERYLATVRRHAARHDLDTRVVLAVIQTESFFNPKARSPVPAFGLMQLVPASGGRDAYKHVHGEDRAPSLDELYDPERNIELGCAYLALIRDRYLAGITDPLSRLYCTICAYNTGAGNVSRAFTGDNHVRPAVARINKLPPTRVLDTLKTDLPYAETRRYIADVLKRVGFYEEWKD